MQEAGTRDSADAQDATAMRTCADSGDWCRAKPLSETDVADAHAKIPRCQGLGGGELRDLLFCCGNALHLIFHGISARSISVNATSNLMLTPESNPKWPCHAMNLAGVNPQRLACEPEESARSVSVC